MRYIVVMKDLQAFAMTPEEYWKIRSQITDVLYVLVVNDLTISREVAEGLYTEREITEKKEEEKVQGQAEEKKEE